MSKPIAAWAYTDRYPAGYDFENDVDTNSCRLGLDAVENWQGISYVDITFSGAVPVVTDANVTDQGGNTYRILNKRWADVVGEGNEADYWYVDIDLTGVAHGVTYTVSEVTIRTTGDVTNHTMILGGEMTARTIVVWRKASLVVKHLDPSATGAANGNSWTDAYTTVTAAENGCSTSVNMLRCRGSAALTANVGFYANRTVTNGWLILVDDDGTADWNYSGFKLTLSGWCGIRGINATISGAAGQLKLDGYGAVHEGHGSMRNMTLTVSDRLNTSPVLIAPCENYDAINITQNGGFRGLVINYSTSTEANDGIVQNCNLTDSGTFANGLYVRTLVEKCSAIDCMKDDDGFTPGTHSDFLHPFMTAATALNVSYCAENAIFRYNVTYNSGASIADGDTQDLTYNFCLLDDSGLNVAMYNNQQFNYMLTQQNVQIEQGNSLNPFGNIQVFHNTLLTYDTVAQGDDRGITISGNGATEPYAFGEIYIANNILNTLATSTGGNVTSPLDDLVANFTACSIGPNVFSDQDVSSLLTTDGSIQTASGGNTAFNLISLNFTSPDLTPLGTSDAVGLASASDARFDYNGVALSRDGTDEVGAIQIVAAGAASINTHFPKLSGALNISLSGKMSGGLT